MILGIDEVGRGPWAGPLVVGAVVLGGSHIDGLTDSKKLTKKRREALYPIIRNQALACATGWVSARELDEVGMSGALRLATRRAVEQIHVPYSEIILDGTVNFLAGTGKGEYVQLMKKADLLVPSVSAASSRPSGWRAIPSPMRSFKRLSTPKMAMGTRTGGRG